MGVHGLEKREKGTAKKGWIAVLITTLLLAVMEMTGLPVALLPQVDFWGINPIYLILLVNFIIGGLLCSLLKRLFFPEWTLGLKFDGVGGDLRRYGLAGAVTAAASIAAFAAGLRPAFNVEPSVGQVLVEGVFYCIGVSLFEEVYLRGLLQNMVEKIMGPRKNAVMWAVLISSMLFALGHIAGALSGGLLVAAAKALWTFGLGIYLGAVYKKTANLWVPAILHMLVNLSGILFCFTTTTSFPTAGIWVNVIAFMLLGAYGLWLLKNPGEQEEQQV